MRIRHPLALAIALVTAGCAAVGPNYRVPEAAIVNAPAAQGAFLSGGEAVTAEPLPDHWWRLYEDPRLDGLVEQALARNTDLRVAEANLERSSALLAEAQSGRFSGLADVEVNYVQQSAEAALQHVQPPERYTYNGGIGISYDLDLFGGIRRGIEAASADQEAVVAARDLARVSVAAETTRAYADICNGGRQLDVLRRSIAVQQQGLTLTRTLVRNGRAPQFEQQRQQGAIENSLAQLAPLAARQRNAAFRLATLMGIPPRDYDPAWLSCAAPLQLKNPIPTGDGGALLRRRPDVRAAERRLAAATARIGVATAALYPDIRLGATLGSTGAAVDALSALTNRFGVGPAISWDLHRSAVRDRIAASQAGAKASLASFDGTVLAALRETETSLDTYAAALVRLKRLRQSEQQAAVVMARTRELRKGGRVGGLVALDSERSWIAAVAASASAEADVNADQITVFQALGGGWS
ncbi:efflux transporter outer membrane subunit [Sphingomonas oryzagri]|uniref:Efflux transporter outer membrane subunit n=1 Tax=Sphingomonas oryzagri TaxID=3042314 RepID=A0ABT6N5W4_9SPHN|nr:efflux transporter outer membrane subunit [Sphingomonas oryzagri]MDH7640492.1 efflux transporter outer membrane subunit [Sphingomonas oryzagri]